MSLKLKTESFWNRHRFFDTNVIKNSEVSINGMAGFLKKSIAGKVRRMNSEVGMPHCVLHSNRIGYRGDMSSYEADGREKSALSVALTSMDESKPYAAEIQIDLHLIDKRSGTCDKKLQVNPRPDRITVLPSIYAARYDKASLIRYYLNLIVNQHYLSLIKTNLNQSGDLFLIALALERIGKRRIDYYQKTN